MKLVYITNTDLKESSGGGSGVNFATHDFLGKAFEIEETLVIKPNPDFFSKLKSVLLKKMGLKRNYHSFSEGRLKGINKHFSQFEQKNILPDFYFFHGFTQWIKTRPSKPYFCFNDACFATYVEIYNDRNEFSKKDLDRIYKEEANWLKNAQKVFFRSQWALEETKETYDLEGENFVNVGVGGFIDIPNEDKYKDGYNFLFISREFIPKGGKVVVRAIQELKKTYDFINLWIVGEDPGNEIKNIEGVEYLGFFNKADTNDKMALIKIFENAFALIHPTVKDTNTLVINELSYFGCVAISSNKFAIPEYLIDGYTGYLINDPRDVNELKSLMEKLIVNTSKYFVMREQARSNAIKNNTWEAVGERIIKEISSQFQA